MVSIPTVNDPILVCGAQCFLMSNFLEMKKAGVQSQGGAMAENMLALLAVCWWVTRISAGLFSSCLQCANAQPDWMAVILLLTHISKVTRRLMQHLHHSSFVIILPYFFGFHHDSATEARSAGSAASSASSAGSGTDTRPDGAAAQDGFPHG